MIAATIDKEKGLGRLREAQ
jgi:hypothetical protein